MASTDRQSNLNQAAREVPGLSRRSFLVAGSATALTSATLVSALDSPAMAAASTNALSVGAGKAAISIPASLLPLDNFTTVHDDLFVKVLLLENKARRVAFIVLDLTSISEEAITDIRTVVSAASGVASSDIIVTVTHSFSAPHVMPSTSSAQEATWIGNITAAAKDAVDAAVSSLQTATIGYGTGRCDVNVNRNVDTADGYWLGTNELLPSDKRVGVARINGTDGNPIAVLINYNVQSCVMQDSVMASGDLPITADLAGAATAHVEAQYPGAIAFWIVGACGDQFPAFRSKRYTIDKNRNWAYDTDAHDAGFLLLTVQGERLGTEVVRVAQTIRTSRDSSLRLVIDQITVNSDNPPHVQGPVKTADFSITGTTTTPIWVLRAGNGVIAGAEPELSTTTADFIKQQSAFAHTFVASMFEGGAKNMPAKWNYDHVTYEALDGSFARGSAERVANQVVRVIRSLD